LGHLPVLAALVDGGAEVDVAKHRGDTPLLYAAHQDRAAAVSALVTAGTAVDAASVNGVAALTHAPFADVATAAQALLPAMRAWPPRMQTEKGCSLPLPVPCPPL